MLGGLMVVLLVSLVGCGSDSKDKDSVLGGASAKSADLVINDTFPFYDRTDLKIPLNQDVTFTVLNKGKNVHNVTIPGFVIDMDIAPGESVEIKIPKITEAPRDGFYTMYCKYHQNQGEATKINISK
jgi:plastocyanin